MALHAAYGAALAARHPDAQRARAGGNKQIDWIQYKGEDPGWMTEVNNVDFWTRVEKFLARHLK